MLINIELVELLKICVIRKVKKKYHNNNKHYDKMLKMPMFYFLFKIHFFQREKPCFWNYFKMSFEQKVLSPLLLVS